MAEYKDITSKYQNNIQVGYEDTFDEEAIQNSLYNLFLINQGEIPGKPWLGNPLQIFLFDNIGYFETQAIRVAFINIIEKYEPRIDLIDVNIGIESEYNNIVIDIVYSPLLGRSKQILNYRFSVNYNNITNISLRRTT
jgi:phage baseplate assembly protein W